MVENRYQGLLQNKNRQLVEIQPAHPILRIEIAIFLRGLAKGKQIKILELGCGEGDLTKFLLDYSKDITLTCLDVSPEMIVSAKTFLAEYSKRISFIEADALNYLETSDAKYDIILTSWTIHNFKQEAKEKLHKTIFSKLKEGGKFIFMDKVYPTKDSIMDLLSLQCNRYKFLEKNLGREIILHEIKDASEDYIMLEEKVLNQLSEIGFKKIEILDRVERDVLMTAEK